jgi:anti-anti-sigma factor
VAILCNGPALGVIAPDQTERAGHEADLGILADTGPLRVLCRYSLPRDTDPWLAGVLGPHQGIADVAFAARRDADRLTVAGEIDAANAERFATILTGALDDGVTTVELADVSFLAAAGVTAIISARERAERRGQRLTLASASRPAERVLDLCGLAVAGRGRDAR